MLSLATKGEKNDPILDDEEFFNIVELFTARKTIGRHTSEDRYLLSGLVVCGHCGAKMNGKMNKSFSKRKNIETIYYQYLCDGYLKKGNCSHHFVHRDELENVVMKHITEVATVSPGKLQLVIAKKENHSTLEREALLSRLKKLDSKIQKQLEAYEEDLISAHDLKLARIRIDEERVNLEELLDELNTGQADKAQKKIHDNVNRLIGQIASEDRLKSKQTIRQLIQKITIHNGEDIEITWLA